MGTPNDDKSKSGQDEQKSRRQVSSSEMSEEEKRRRLHQAYQILLETARRKHVNRDSERTDNSQVEGERKNND
jgi:hypothetical protein